MVISFINYCEWIGDPNFFFLCIKLQKKNVGEKIKKIRRRRKNIKNIYRLRCMTNLRTISRLIFSFFENLSLIAAYTCQAIVFLFSLSLPLFSLSLSLPLTLFLIKNIHFYFHFAWVFEKVLREREREREISFLN